MKITEVANHTDPKTFASLPPAPADSFYAVTKWEGAWLGASKKLHDVLAAVAAHHYGDRPMGFLVAWHIAWKLVRIFNKREDRA